MKKVCISSKNGNDDFHFFEQFFSFSYHSLYRSFFFAYYESKSLKGSAARRPSTSESNPAHMLLLSLRAYSERHLIWGFELLTSRIALRTFFTRPSSLLSMRYLGYPVFSICRDQQMHGEAIMNILHSFPMGKITDELGHKLPLPLTG